MEIIEPTEGATATLIAVGKGDFGISYQEDVTIALTSKDPLPIKTIATLIQHNTSGFVTYADKDIKSPKDFEGKTYAGWGGPGEEAVLKAVMTKDGADFSKLNMVISDGSGFEALKGKVDIEWFFEGWDNVKCKLNNFPINYMELRQLDDRLDYYTPVIIANQDTLEQKPEMVITEQNRSRDWLYSQGELRQKIHRQIMGDRCPRPRKNKGRGVRADQGRDSYHGLWNRSRGCQMGDGALPNAGSRRNSVSGFWSPSMVCGSMEGGGYDTIPGKMPGDR